MKHIKLFENFNSTEPLILYHGTPFKFEEEKFKGDTIFLSEIPAFAYKYAEQKADDMQIDRTITLYKCRLKANLFNIKNKEHSQKLYEALPEWVNFLYSNGMRGELPRDEYILAMNGIEVEKGFDMNIINGLSTGDSFRYNSGESQFLIDVDDDYVYYISMEYMYSGWDKSGIKDKNEYLLSLKNDKRTRKESRKDVHVPTEETWIYFEYWKTTKIIKDLGFDGYAASERGVTTYAIFNLDTITILEKS